MCFLEAEFPPYLQCGAGKGILSAFQALRFLCDITSPGFAQHPLPPRDCLDRRTLVRQRHPWTQPSRAFPWGCSARNTSNDASLTGTSRDCRGCSEGLGTSRMCRGLMSCAVIIMSSNDSCLHRSPV